MEESKEEYIERLVRSRPSNRWSYQFILVASTTTLLAVMSYIYVQTGVCPSILRNTKACDVYESIFYAPFFSDVVKVYVFIIFGILISHPIGMLAKFCTGYSSEPPRECRRCREELEEEEENEEEHLVEGDGEDSEEGDEEDSEEGEGEASEESEEDNKDEVSKGKNEQQSTKKSSQAEKDQKDQSHSSEGTSSSDDEQDDDVVIRNEKVAEEEVVEEMENTAAHSSETKITVDTSALRVSPAEETATVVQHEEVSDVEIQSEDVQDIVSTFEEPTTVADTRDDKRESSEFESKTLNLDEIDQTPLNEKETVILDLVEKEADDATVDTSIPKQKEGHDEEAAVTEALGSDHTTVNQVDKLSSENDLPQKILSEPDISVEEESNDNATEENGSEDMESSSKPSPTMDISKFAEDMKKCYQALEDIEEDKNLAQVLNLVTETCQVLSESHNGAEDMESSSKPSPTTPINSDASLENSVDTSTFAEDMKKCYQALEEIEEDKNLTQVLNLATEICQVLSESHRRKTEKVGELDAACEKSDVPRSGANEHEFRQAVEESEEANNSEHSPISDYGTEAFTYDVAESNIDMLSIDSKRETRDAPQSDVAAESVMQPSPIPSEKDSGMNTAESSDTETQPPTKKSSNTLDSSELVFDNESDDSEMEQNKTHVLSLVEVADAKVLEKHLIHEGKIDSADELDESSTF